MSIINILKEKGYSGKEDFFEISEWLQKRGIFVELQTVWNEDGTEQIGFRSTFWFSPYEISDSSEIMYNYKDAFECMLFRIKDFIW